MEPLLMVASRLAISCVCARVGKYTISVIPCVLYPIHKQCSVDVMGQYSSSDKIMGSKHSSTDELRPTDLRCLRLSIGKYLIKTFLLKCWNRKMHIQTIWRCIQLYIYINPAVPKTSICHYDIQLQAPDCCSMYQGQATSCQRKLYIVNSSL